MNSEIADLGPLKVQFSILTFLQKPTDDTLVSCHANTFAKGALTQLDEDDYLNMTDQPANKIQLFCTGGSGFIVKCLDHMNININ